MCDIAERRMFAKTIVLSDAFLDMPLSTRCLYFTLGMMADDDGFVNSPKSIIRQTGASEDDIKLLIAKKFILPFESGLIVIKHWRINNYLRNDRYSETKYIDEKCQLLIEDNGAYTFGIPNNGIPSKDKDRLDNISSSALPDESADKPIKSFEHDSNPYKCASFLAFKIKERVPNKKIEERTIQQWACEIEKINRIDGQEWKTISAVLDFSQKDAFWSKNVLSGTNLRKNFDRLYLKMQEDT